MAAWRVCRRAGHGGRDASASELGFIKPCRSISKFLKAGDRQEGPQGNVGMGTDFQTPIRSMQGLF